MRHWLVGKRLVNIISVAVVAAAVVNGAGTYLRRTGVLARSEYRGFWSTYTPMYEWQRECKRIMRTSPSADRPPFPGLSDFDRSYIYRVTAFDVPFKLAKDAVIAAFLIISCLAWYKNGGVQQLRLNHAPVLMLLLLIAICSISGFFLNGPLLTVTGLRMFSVLPVCLLAGWFKEERGYTLLSRSLILLLVLQFLLFPFELCRGIVMLHQNRFGIGLPSRLWGTFVHPSSMGVFAVLSLAFAQCKGGLGLRSLIMAWFAVIVAVFASGTATAILCLLVLGMIQLLRLVPENRRVKVVSLSILLLLVVVYVLPTIVSRSNIYESLFGRGRILVELIQANAGWQNVLGRGIGAGTNTAIVSSDYLNLQCHPAAIFDADSTITSLYAQIGVLGVLLFYAILYKAAHMDCSLRSFYLVLAISSITMNIMELFPVNLLFALAVAGSLNEAQKGPDNYLSVLS